MPVRPECPRSGRIEGLRRGAIPRYAPRGATRDERSSLGAG